MAEHNPEAIHQVNVSYVQGLQPYQCRQVGFAMGLSNKNVGQLTKIMMGMFKLFNDYDLSLIELNPLAIVASGDLMALDGKINSDDNAAFRQPDLQAMRDIAQEDHTEVLASKYDLNYVDHGRRYRLHGQRRRSGDGDHGRDFAERRFAGEFPRRRRRRDQGARDAKRSS